ncbi:unnamed protein product [Schistocephalus solidus]|uniref:Uncharacterized protein n=1 Tax=Schistocephalus solidus TaxID=70667 RepID=A0A3P7F1I7_SCHSO|nr:unnamed protein product [Schistocephalus solidus]
MAYSDILWNRIQTMQDYSLCRYPGVLPAWFHLSFASAAEGGKSWAGAAGDRGFSAIRWPTSYLDNQSSANRSEAVIDTILENQWRAAASANVADAGVGLPTSLRCLTRQRFLLDASSYVNTLFSAMCSRLRPVNIQLYTEQEKKQLIHLVSFVVNMGLDLVPVQTDDSEEQTYRLEPPLDSIARFTSSTRLDKEASYATKQMLARELVLERMRRAEVTFSLQHPPSGRRESSGWPETGATPLVTSPRAPLPDSFMSSRMGPTAKPMDASGKQKVMFLRGFSFSVLGKTCPFLRPDAMRLFEKKRFPGRGYAATQSSVMVMKKNMMGERERESQCEPAVPQKRCRKDSTFWRFHFCSCI